MTTYEPPRPWIASYAEGVPDDLTPVSGSLVDIVEASAREYPEAPALQFFGRTTSYRELHEAIDRAAAGLRDRGVVGADVRRGEAGGQAGAGLLGRRAGAVGAGSGGRLVGSGGVRSRHPTRVSPVQGSPGAPVGGPGAARAGQGPRRREEVRRQGVVGVPESPVRQGREPAQAREIGGQRLVAKVFTQVVDQRPVVAERGQHIDEAQHLEASALIAHQPLDEQFLFKPGQPARFARGPGLREQFAPDGLNTRLERRQMC